MTEATISPRPTLGVWMQAARAFSFTASMTPIILGAMIALWDATRGVVPAEGILWCTAPIIVLCSLLVHAGTNLVSEYFDLKRGVDREDTLGSSGVLIKKMLTPKQVLNAGNLLFVLCFALGLILVWQRGTPILVLGLIGLLGGYAYTGSPIGYKYWAMGDVLVFLLMGPMMVGGSYYVLTGTYSVNVFLLSVPIGFLVTAILAANNVRDINDDARAGAKTMATVLGERKAKMEYVLLVLGAYAWVTAMVVTKHAEPWVLITLISLPPALKNIKAVQAIDLSNIRASAMVDVSTAQHHAMFGVLFSLGILLSVWF